MERTHDGRCASWTVVILSSLTWVFKSRGLWAWVRLFVASNYVSHGPQPYSNFVSMPLFTLSYQCLLPLIFHCYNYPECCTLGRSNHEDSSIHIYSIIRSRVFTKVLLFPLQASRQHGSPAIVSSTMIHLYWYQV